MSSRNPKICIICHQDAQSDPSLAKINKVSEMYSLSISKAGALPFLIPVDFPLNSLSEIRNTFDGILLIGGGDVANERYGGKPHSSVSAPDPVRDELEISLVHLALKTEWPILGICRGIQVMNVAMGGSLYSDIADQYPNEIRHNSPQGTPRDKIIHEVHIKTGTRLFEIFGKSSISVNSFHHQAVKSPASCFIVSGETDHGLIEAIEVSERKFAIGVQWHPECLPESEDQQRLFQAFINACK